MTSTRAVTAVVAVAGALLLTACGSQDPDPAVAAHETAVISTRPSATTASAVPIDRSTPAPVPPSDTSTPDPQPTTTVAPPPVTSETSVASAPPPPRRPASPSGALDARSPEQVVADSGERGRHYLAALRAGGIPPTGMDAAEVLYAQGTCEALARGDSRASVLAEFDSVGQAYARFVPMPADRIAEIYVSTAERTYC